MEGSIPILESALVGIFVLLMIIQLRDFLQLLPYLFDSLFRARGSVALDSSVPVSRTRDNIAITLLIPFILLLYRYQLWYPSFLRGWQLTWQLASILGCFVAYLLLRFLLYVWMKPRRRYDFYQLSHLAVYTYFIIFCMFLFLPSFGIMALVGVPEAVVRPVLGLEAGGCYLFLLVRRAQILSLSCNPLRTFLYLCGLEIIPTALWVISGIAL